MTRARGDGSTTRTTKVGKASTPRLAHDDHKLWCACFTAAIGGIMAAHRRTPNPDLVIRLASRVADRGFQECRRRKDAA
jgi:hypothetical protein